MRRTKTNREKSFSQLYNIVYKSIVFSNSLQNERSLPSKAHNGNILTVFNLGMEPFNITGVEKTANMFVLSGNCTNGEIRSESKINTLDNMLFFEPNTDKLDLHISDRKKLYVESRNSFVQTNNISDIILRAMCLLFGLCV